LPIFLSMTSLFGNNIKCNTLCVVTLAQMCLSDISFAILNSVVPAFLAMKSRISCCILGSVIESEKLFIVVYLSLRNTKNQNLFIVTYCELYSIKLSRSLTTIQIQKATRLDLMSVGRKGESYDHLLQRLIQLEKENMKNEYSSKQ